MVATLSEYYKSIGQALPSVSARAPIYAKYGLTGTYTGSPTQNNALLAKLLAGGTPVAGSAPATTPVSGGFTTDQLNATYQKLLGRTPDPSGLAEYGSSKYAGKTVADLEKIIMASPEYQQKTANPSTIDQITQQVTDVNNMAFDKFTLAEAPKTRTPEEIKTAITAELPAATEKPTPLNLEATYTKMRTELNVDALEASATDLASQKADIQAQYDTLVTDEQGKPILTRLISGRTAKMARDFQKQLDFITRQEAVVTDQLNTKYSVINTRMGFKQTDYQTEKAAYDSDYTNALNMINAISTIQAGEKADLKAFKDDARANLTLYSNLFQSGQLTWDGLTSDQKNNLNKLEVQAGLGIGYLRSVQSLSGGAEIKSITTRQAPDGYEYADAITIMPDGSLKVVTTQLGKYKAASTGGATLSQEEKDIRAFQSESADMIQKLDTGDIEWGAAFDSLKAKYPSASNTLIDKTLGGGYDEAKGGWWGRAATASK